MRRRDLISTVGPAAVWAFAARAQVSPPVIGILFGGSAALMRAGLPAFLSGLSELGFTEGQNVTIEYRVADGQYERLPALISDLVSRKVDVIVPLASRASLAAKAATSTIPTVFAVAVDPVALGLVASLNRPGGNLTGATFLSIELTAKQLELVHALSPSAGTVGFLINPEAPDIAAQTGRAQAAAKALALTLQVVNVRADSELEGVFNELAERHVGALVVGGDEFLASEAARIAALAARYEIPTVYPLRVFIAASGLASYGASLPEALHQAGIYVGRVLKGIKPADLPVVQSSKFELVINLKTAKALGLTVPQSLLLRADEVIE